MKRHLLAFISATLLFAGCGNSNNSPLTSTGLDNAQQDQLWFNGLWFNGLWFNGLWFNGLWFNGLWFNGLGWTGGGGGYWQGMGWTGSGFSNPAITPDWGLDAFVNHSDANGDSVIDVNDRNLRLSFLAYWTGCAGSATDTLTWDGDNPYAPGPHPNHDVHTFPGGLGMAPTWIAGLGPVPADEQEGVTACLAGLINPAGIHNAVSMRGYNPSLRLADNEKLFNAYPEALFSGNVFDSTTQIYDPATHLNYDRIPMNACHYAWHGLSMQLDHDLGVIAGRICPWGSCSPAFKTTQACFKDGTVDGSYSTGTDPITGMTYSTPDPAVTLFGPNNSIPNGYPDNYTGQQYVSYRGNSSVGVSTYLGAFADLEVQNWKLPGYQCNTGCPPMDGCACYDNYCNGSGGGGGEGGGGTGGGNGGGTGGGNPVMCEYPSDCNICSTVVAPVLPGAFLGTSAPCTPASKCVRGWALTGLAANYWLEIGFTQPFDIISRTMVSGTANRHKAGTLRFSYANGSAVPARIQIKDLIRNTMLDGTGFVPTPGGWDDYHDRDYYPIYPGLPFFTGTTRGIDLAIAADPASPVFPRLDYAQYWVGMPYGMTAAREMYDDEGAGKGQIPEGGQASINTQIQVGADGFVSDFSQVHNMRLRLDAIHPNPAELQITVAHGTTNIVIQGASLDPNGWSPFVQAFYNDDPANGPWQVSIMDMVPNNSNGILNMVYVEFMQ